MMEKKVKKKNREDMTEERCKRIEGVNDGKMSLGNLPFFHITM